MLELLHTSINEADPNAPSVGRCLVIYAKWGALICGAFAALTWLAGVLYV